MRAMILNKPKTALELVEIPIPVPNENQILIKVQACGVCRTDLHILDGELQQPKLPLILGHQIVGTVVKAGKHTSMFKIGDKVGVPWLGGSCGQCRFCTSGRENLCDYAVYTGYQIDGGFAEYCVANEKFSFKIPDFYSDLHAAPLLCGGLIGYRAYRMTGQVKKLGLYGFGSSAHVLAQLALYEKKKVFAFTSKGDIEAQHFAISMGVHWSGDSETAPPEVLDAAIIFAPVGKLIPLALKALDKGGTVMCAGIHMSDIPSFPYSLLYQERNIRSVTNLTRQDGVEFLELAPQIPIKTTITCYPLEQVNQALKDLKEGSLKGSAVIQIHAGEHL